MSVEFIVGIIAFVGFFTFVTVGSIYLYEKKKIS